MDFIGAVVQVVAKRIALEAMSTDEWEREGARKDYEQHVSKMTGREVEEFDKMVSYWATVLSKGVQKR